MDNVLTIAEERLNLFAHMANSACGLSLWCFGMKKQLYTCTCPAEKEFRLFLDLGQCLDYAIAHGPESHTPILMSVPSGAWTVRSSGALNVTEITSIGCGHVRKSCLFVHCC